MKYLVFILLFSFTASGQNSKKKVYIQHNNSDSLEVIEGKRKYAYNFIFPKASVIDSYFILSRDETFYIKYEFKGSARSLYFIIAEFKWKAKNIYLNNYTSLNNREGQWSGVVKFLDNKQISNFDQVEEIFFSVENNDKIHVFKNSREIATMNLPNEIENEMILDDEVIFKILNEAKDISIE
ncbi:hypothetical protein EG359_02310 [Chryseobacterium joostei]|uniref:Uncharacterized protein n=1 Tax=Chryseobacterium joostei TaxID=112234 RepID=A0A1N7IM50_9FLAO|nr:hypothetical protein [Chryseobacterium joostei]AZA98508.1 hypothetical protein EG359_02310 [Chryseobacterium joostei]SIS38132.1 hypothetical protein SAMN05421768_10664 [Chryseobacterium joostei]